MKAPTNIKELRDDLLKVYTGLRTGKTSAAEATAVTNTAGKVIQSCKVQLDYSKLRGEQPNVDFLDAE